MKTDSTTQQIRDPRWLLAALSFAVICCFGGVGSFWAMFQMQKQAEAAASAHAQAFATSVARTLAGQFENAVSHGAPLNQIPRVGTYLENIQRATPGVSQIVLKDTHGKVFSITQVSTDGGTTKASVPISVHGKSAGTIEVEVAASQFGQQSGMLIWLLPVAIVAVATLTAALVAWGLMRGATRAQELLGSRLAPSMVLTPPAHNEFAEKTDDDPWQAMLHSLLEGDTRLQDKLTAFENLAQEILAVDFDDQLAPRIAAIRAHALRSLDQEAD